MDLPLVVQVSRFDKWKDPQGVIDAFRMARQEIDCTLVLVGNVATDDPEGQEVFESLCRCREDRIHILSVQDSALVNALQRRATVVLQKSIREGFGLTVAEAMWKGTPVIGGNVGGIRHQIETATTASWSRASSKRPRGSSGSSRIRKSAKTSAQTLARPYVIAS